MQRQNGIDEGLVCLFCESWGIAVAYKVGLGPSDWIT